jgi:hypothetical protein
MDSLKFAFDTLIIGALALPWLWLFMRIFFQRTDNQKDIKFPVIDAFPDATKELVGGVLILAVGYFLGSAVSRVSSDFFDDRDILLGLPTQSSIRQGVYIHEYCDAHGVLIATKLPAELAALTGGRAGFCREPDLDELITEFFGLQEGRLLLVGEDKLARLREFHDQIEILRGAILNGGLLFMLSSFALCALYRDRAPTGKLRTLLKGASYLPALTMLIFGLWTMGMHFSRLGQPEAAASTANFAETGQAAPAPIAPLAVNRYEGYRDPPLAEAVMILLGIGGLLLRLSGENPRLYRNVCLIAAVLTITAYGSWWWTEVIYDEQVIHSVEK